VGYLRQGDNKLYWQAALLAVFFASDEARYVNGATITVDGGWYATNQLGGLGFNMPGR